MKSRFRVLLMLMVLLVSGLATYVQFIRQVKANPDPASGYEWESSPQNHFSDLTVTWGVATKEGVGIGDGIQKKFFLSHSPVIPGTDLVYLNEVPTTDYTIVYRTGNITFTTAPADNVVITADYEYYAAYDQDTATYAYFEYSEKSGEFRLYNFSIPTDVVGSLPDIASVDFYMRYNTSGANTADSPDDMYRIFYYVSPNTTPQVLVDWRKDTYTYLKVDNFDDARKNWTRVGASPYLHDDEVSPTNYIHESMGVLLRPDGDGTYTDWTGTYQDWDEEFVMINEAVGTGNDWQTLFQLDHYPLIPDTERVYLDNLTDPDPPELTRDYTIDFNTGEIDFYTAPPSGFAITADYKYADTYVSAATPNLNQSSTIQDPSAPLPTGLGDITNVRVSVIARNTITSDDRIVIPVVIDGSMYDPEYVVTGEAVGTGDGSTTVFYLDHTPVQRDSDTVYLDAVEQTRKNATHANDYAIDYAIGKITFTTAPGGGVAVTADYRHGHGIQDRHVPPTTYGTLWSEWSKNPATGNDWTWAEINALQACVRTKQVGASWTGEIRVAQIFVQVFLTAATIGDFSLENIATYDGGRVYLEIKARTEAGEIPTRWPEPRDSVKIFVYDGAMWQDVGSIAPDETFRWRRSLDLTSIPATDWALNTTAKINAAKVRLVKETYFEYAAPTADRIEVDAIRLRVANEGFPEEPSPQVGLPPYPPAYNWTNQAEPNDLAWNWTDVNNIKFAVETQRSGGPDPGCGFFMYETWVTVNLPNASVTLRPRTVIDYSVKPQPPAIIRPNANGAKTTWTGTPNNNYLDWADDPTHDYDSSYVYTNSPNNPIFGGESSHLANPTHQTWDPAGVRVVAYARYENTTPMDDQLALTLVLGTKEYVMPIDDLFSLTTNYEKYSYEWGLNPFTVPEALWTWTDIDNLQAGVFAVTKGATFDGQIRVTQLYVEILGPTFKVDIKTEDVTNVFAYELNCTYDTTWLTVIGYFPAYPFLTATVPPVINETVGWVYVAWSIPLEWTVEEGASGNRTLGTIFFLVEGFGRSTLEIRDPKSLSKPGSIVAPLEITFEVYNGYFRNTLLGDISGSGGVPDGTVDNYDLSMMGDGFGSSPEDPNWVWVWPDYEPDEIADIHDLWTIGKEYGQSA